MEVSPSLGKQVVPQPHDKDRLLDDHMAEALTSQMLFEYGLPLNEVSLRPFARNLVQIDHDRRLIAKYLETHPDDLKGVEEILDALADAYEANVHRLTHGG